jgi:uncharacterized protein (UPF0335 family)
MAKTLKAGDGSNIGGMVDRKKLTDYRDRIARIMEEQKALSVDIKEIAAQCDEAGVASKKEIRKLARESLMDQDVLHDQLERMDLLRGALGVLVDTPLGQATVEAKGRADAKKRGRPRPAPNKADAALERAQQHLGTVPRELSQEEREADELIRSIGDPAGSA